MVRAKRRVFPGRSDQVAHARHFVERALDGCPVADEAVLCVSELATNTLLHTATGDGGMFEVVVQRGDTWVHVAVRDDGSDKIPAAQTPGEAAEDGRGLGLVGLVADRWGQAGDESGRTVWFELDWQVIHADSAGEPPCQLMTLSDR